MNEFNVVCKPFNPKENWTLPVRKTRGSSGYDLYSSGFYHIKPNKTMVVKTNLIIQPPLGIAAKIESRSSLAIKGVFVLGGIIDADYTGEVGIILYNSSNFTIVITPKTACAQLCFYQYHFPNLVVGTVEETERGTGGFGSTNHV